MQLYCRGEATGNAGRRRRISHFLNLAPLLFVGNSPCLVGGFGCLPPPTSRDIVLSTTFLSASLDNESDKNVPNGSSVDQIQQPLLSSKSSPWASAWWILRLNFGRSSTRTEEIDYPFSFSEKSSYGASGSRLTITCPVLVTAEDVVGQDRTDLVVGRGSSVIRPIYSLPPSSDEIKLDFSKHFSYITLQGQRTVKISPGGWVLEFPPSSMGPRQNNKNKGVASKLRFWLDLENDVERNDIKLAAGTRLYFAANCWREDDFDVGVAKLKPIQQEAEAALRLLQENLSHESGDRRLDGVDALETIQAYGDMAKLVLEKEQKMARLQEALLVYPSAVEGDAEFLPDGPWPGSDEWLTLSDEKYNPIFVLKDQGILRGREYQMVGTWTAEAVVDED
jgi:hypothetical protein